MDKLIKERKFLLFDKQRKSFGACRKLKIKSFFLMFFAI